MILITRGICMLEERGTSELALAMKMHQFTPTCVKATHCSTQISQWERWKYYTSYSMH